MARATYHGSTIAESDDTVVVEGNHYFPRGAVADGVTLHDSATTSVCPWKGTASYYTIDVDGEQVTDGAWFYPQPKDAAKQITDRLAFWNGVEVTD